MHEAETLRDRLTRWLSTGGEVPTFRTTHLSVLASTRDRVYKAKLPFRFAFCDMSTLERRWENARHELELNQRFAPDVYLGITELPDGPPEPLLVMRRMPDARRLGTLIDDDRDVGACIEAVAARVGDAHLASPHTPMIDAASDAAAVAELWRQAFEQTRPYVGRVLASTDASRVERLATRYLAGRRQLFEARVRTGHAVDGHGDLLADDIFCLDDGPRILDCLEFDARLRYGDALADVAFLAMDLERRGRPDLARRFLDRYAESTGDAWPASLEDHWVAYRAHVRAKVACLRHDEGDPAAASHARLDLRLARRRLEHGRVRLVLVGGLPGTGKTTLAHGLAQSESWTVLRSDVIRKELAGMTAEAPAPASYESGLYTPDATARTYAEIVSRAEHALAHGETVVLDASWADARHRRAAAAVAARSTSDLVQLECTAPPALAGARIAGRRGDASDADVEIAGRMAARFDPWPEASAVDTSAPVEEVIAVALARCTDPDPP
jgi:aminoglycoside phosphotransferase family enzyme/predicted kinase